MGVERAELNVPTMVARAEAPVANGKVTDGTKTSMESEEAASKEAVGGRGEGPLGGLTDDEIASTLAAASEKLQVAHRRDQKNQKKVVARCFGALYPKRFLSKFRDLYINTCMMAAEKGDFVDLVAGHPGMYYGDTVMSRNISQRRDREHEEILQASLTRQVSISLSRQLSQQNQSGLLKMTRNTSTGLPGVSRSGSTGIPGLSRNASTGMPGLNRNSSTGIMGLNWHTTGSAGRNTFGRSSSTRKAAEPNLFSGGRENFLQDLATTHLNSKVASAPERDISKPGKVEALPLTVKADETMTPVH